MDKLHLSCACQMDNGLCSERSSTSWKMYRETTKILFSSVNLQMASLLVKIELAQAQFVATIIECLLCAGCSQVTQQAADLSPSCLTGETVSGALRLSLRSKDLGQGAQSSAADL